MTVPTIGRRILAGGGLLAAALPARVRAQAAVPVRIGVLTDLAGPYADSGGPGSVLAAQMAMRDFGGAVLGTPVEVLAADTCNKPDVAPTTSRYSN